jgi:hypothetical protein
MTTSNHDRDSIARKSYSSYLAKLQGQGVHIAAALEVNPSTISRDSEHAERVLRIAAHAGLKLVAIEKICVDPAELKFLRHVYSHVLENAPHLLSGGDE